MELVFQIFDCDYILLDSLPVVRLFGKTEEGKTDCVFGKNYSPYFYAKTDATADELKNFLDKKFKNQIQKVEEVQKFLAQGFQEEKTRILKITSKDPSQVPIIRDSLLGEKFI